MIEVPEQLVDLLDAAKQCVAVDVHTINHNWLMVLTVRKRDDLYETLVVGSDRFGSHPTLERAKECHDLVVAELCVGDEPNE